MLVKADYDDRYRVTILQQKGREVGVWGRVMARTSDP